MVRFTCTVERPVASASSDWVIGIWKLLPSFSPIAFSRMNSSQKRCAIRS